MNSRFHIFTTAPSGKRVLIIAGVALLLLIGIIAVTTIAMQPERKTCEEWMTQGLGFNAIGC